MAARFFARLTHRKARGGVRGEGSTPVQWEEPILKHEFEHEKEIWSFVFLQDNVHIVSGSADGTMRKWNCDTGLVVGGPWERKGGKIYALALSPGGKIIACGRKDGSVQRWTTDGVMMDDVWMNHDDRVRSLSWSPNGTQLASGSYDGTILIRRADSEHGKVTVSAIKVSKQDSEEVEALAYSPSGDRIASGGETICVWDTKTNELVVGPIQNMEKCYVMSVAWSSDSTKLYSASGRFLLVFNSTSGELLHSFEHNDTLHSVALSPESNVLACVGNYGVAQLWDTKSHKPLGQPFYQEHHKWLRCVSFSRDGRYVAYGGDNKKLTLWMPNDIAPQLPAPTLLQKIDKRITQQDTWPDSPSSLCLDADATGGGGFIEDAHDDPYNNFFQSSQQSLTSPSSGSHLANLFSARRIWNVISRHHPPPDQSVLQEPSKRGFFSHRARSKSSPKLITIKSNQLELEGKVGEGETEQGENIDDRGSAHGSLSARMDQGKQRDYHPAVGQSPRHRAPTAHLESKDYRTLWERLLQSRGKNSFLHSSTHPANAPQPILHNPWNWNSSLFPAGSSRRLVDIAACREEDRYGIAPESDAEAAAAMLRTNDDVADSSLRPGQPIVVAQASQGQPTQTQASTSRPEEIEVSCCGFVFICRRSN